VQRSASPKVSMTHVMHERSKVSIKNHMYMSSSYVKLKHRKQAEAYKREASRLKRRRPSCQKPKRRVLLGRAPWSGPAAYARM
jgi:hypothetical protein